MNCDRVKLLLNAYLDGELDLVTSLEIEEHLHSCQGCSRERETLAALHAATSDRSLYQPAPAHLEKRIRSALKQASQPPVARPLFPRGWLAPATLLVAMLLLAAVYFGRGLWMPNPETVLAQEVQTAHVRSLMANHLMDVVSSDQHTVKPWFDGKLDFSPPVTDLSAQGYPLDGGRLDYLDGRPVAALVYRRNKHFINLFIWPSQDSSSGLQSSTENGYHLIHWNRAGMTFWAISDVNAEDLITFIDDYQKSTQ
jgi:anti-sigma factor RsiW